MQTYQPEVDEQGVVYARIYVDGQRTSALTYLIPSEVEQEAKTLQEIEDEKPF